MPYQIQPTGPLLTLFKTFSGVGGRIDYVLIGGISPEKFADSYAYHKEAASFAIEAVTTRYPRSLEKGPMSRREPEKARGKQITLAEFFAPGYVEGHSAFINEEFAEGTHQINRVFLPGEPGPYRSNYHFAFSYPPSYPRYNLYDLDEGAEEWLFPAINHELFGDDREALTIYSWSTDWADYFNDGHEWWGSFLWTAYSAQTNILVGIAASAS